MSNKYKYTGIILLTLIASIFFASNSILQNKKKVRSEILMNEIKILPEIQYLRVNNANFSVQDFSLISNNNTKISASKFSIANSSNGEYFYNLSDESNNELSKIFFIK